MIKKINIWWNPLIVSSAVAGKTDQCTKQLVKASTRCSIIQFSSDIPPGVNTWSHKLRGQSHRTGSLQMPVQSLDFPQLRGHVTQEISVSSLDL